jgi:hypothetical protein
MLIIKWLSIIFKEDSSNFSTPGQTWRRMRALADESVYRADKRTRRSATTLLLCKIVISGTLSACLHKNSGVLFIDLQER